MGQQVKPYTMGQISLLFAVWYDSISMEKSIKSLFFPKQEDSLPLHSSFLVSLIGNQNLLNSIEISSFVHFSFFLLIKQRNQTVIYMKIPNNFQLYDESSYHKTHPKR